MTNMPKISARAALALEVLANGGKFRYGLERNNYTGREQFTWRLRGPNGGNIKGVGGATFNELVAAGFQMTRHESGFTGSACYYTLGRGA